MSYIAIVKTLLRRRLTHRQMLPSGDLSTIGFLSPPSTDAMDNGRQNYKIISGSVRRTVCTFISAAVGCGGRQVNRASNQIRSSKIHQPHQRDKLRSSVELSCCIIKGYRVSLISLFSIALCQRQPTYSAVAVSHFLDKKCLAKGMAAIPSVVE